MNKAMAAHCDALGYSKVMQFQFWFHQEEIPGDHFEMFLQDGIAPVIIIIISICLLENIVSVPWSLYGARFEFIRYNSALNSLDWFSKSSISKMPSRLSTLYELSAHGGTWKYKGKNN
jgi:hypothetical protein